MIDGKKITKTISKAKKRHMYVSLCSPYVYYFVNNIIDINKNQQKFLEFSHKNDRIILRREHSLL